MRTVLTSLALAVVFTQAAAAGTIEETFGNTVVATRADGSVDRMHFNADNSYTVTRAAGEEHGRWSVTDGQFCMTPDGGQPSCSPMPPEGKHAGDSWQVGEGAGAVTVSIQAGR